MERHTNEDEIIREDLCLDEMRGNNLWADQYYQNVYYRAMVSGKVQLCMTVDI